MFFALLALISMLPMTAGTPGNDVPVAARLLGDGTVVVVVQTVREDAPLGYSLAFFPPGGVEPSLTMLDTGMEDPTWTRGCFWTSDTTFALTVADGWDREGEPEVLLFRMNPGGFAQACGRIDPLPGAPPGGRVSAVAPGRRRTLFATVDVYGESGDELVAKFLNRVGPEGDWEWSADVPCAGWWMNPDLIRALPDGGCALASDEDGFSGTLYLSRFADDGVRLWSMEYPSGGEMVHSMTEMLPAPDGGLLAVGVTDLFRMQYHTFILLLDREGNILEETLEDALGHLYVNCGITMEDGGWFLAGWTSGSEEGRMADFRKRACYLDIGPDGTVASVSTEAEETFHEPVILLPSGSGVVVVGIAWEQDLWGSDIYMERLEDLP